MNGDLISLAESIRSEVALMGAACRTALGHAANVGRLLNQAKAAVKKAKLSWLRWITDNCRFGDSTANNYMTIAKHWNTLKDEPNLDSLTISEALTLLVEPGRGKGQKAKREKATGHRLSFTLKPGVTLETVLAVLAPLVDVSSPKEKKQDSQPAGKLAA